MIFNCPTVIPPCSPRRFPGTWKQYSKNAIPQLSSTINSSGPCLAWGNHLRWPYQANVINTLETMSKRTGSANRIVASHIGQIIVGRSLVLVEDKHILLHCLLDGRPMFVC